MADIRLDINDLYVTEYKTRLLIFGSSPVVGHALQKVLAITGVSDRTTFRL